MFILLADNPLVCNCDLDWLLYVVDNYMFEKRVSEAKCVVTDQFPYSGKMVGEKYNLEEFKETVKLCDIPRARVLTGKEFPGDSGRNQGTDSQVVGPHSEKPGTDVEGQRKTDKHYVNEKDHNSSANLVKVGCSATLLMVTVFVRQILHSF